MGEVINVPLKGSDYNIIIERGLLKSTSKYIQQVYKRNKISIITDKTVYKYYSQDLYDDLTANGYHVNFIVLEPGESSKSLNSLESVYDELAGFNHERTDLIIALGGGVIGDLAGFAASTYLRGVKYIQIPTTLLAQIDSSVGGKVAVNLSSGKNLVGSFYQPAMVLIDPDTLNTLQGRYIKDGIGEALKYGYLDNGQIYDLISETNDTRGLLENSDLLIKYCCESKVSYVLEDEFDKGKRMLLNFGHTLGHAIEACYNYKTYTHGVAVGMGMYLITKGFEDMGILTGSLSEDITKQLMKYEINFEGFKIDNKDEFIEAIKKDKKIINGELHLVLCKEIGKPFIYKIKVEEIEKYFRNMV